MPADWPEPTMLETGTEFRAEFTLEEFTTQDHIRQTMDDIKEMLLEKNRSYGDSAINPVRIFSKASPEEQLLVRIDDKLSRFARGHDYMGDDDIDDLIGYLVLLKIARKTL